MKILKYLDYSKMSYNFWLITNRVKSRSKKKSRIPCHLEKMLQCPVVEMVLRHNPNIAEFSVPFPKSWVNLAVRIIYSLPLLNVGKSLFGAFAVLDYLGYEHKPVSSFIYVEDWEWPTVVEALKDVPQNGTKFEEHLWNFTFPISGFGPDAPYERVIWSIRVALALANPSFVMEKLKKIKEQYTLLKSEEWSANDILDIANMCHVYLIFSHAFDKISLAELRYIHTQMYKWRFGEIRLYEKMYHREKLQDLLKSLIDEFPISA